MGLCSQRNSRTSCCTFPLVNLGLARYHACPCVLPGIRTCAFSTLVPIRIALSTYGSHWARSCKDRPTTSITRTTVSQIQLRNESRTKPKAAYMPRPSTFNSQATAAAVPAPTFRLKHYSSTAQNAASQLTDLCGAVGLELCSLNSIIPLYPAPSVSY